MTISPFLSDKNDEIDLSTQRTASPTTTAASPSTKPPPQAKVVVEVTEDDCDHQTEEQEDEEDDNLMGKISFNAKNSGSIVSSSREITGLSSLARDVQELTKVEKFSIGVISAQSFHVIHKA